MVVHDDHGFCLDFSWVTFPGSHTLTHHEVTQAAQWRGPRGKKTRAPGDHLESDPSRKLVLQPWPSLQLTTGLADTLTVTS